MYKLFSAFKTLLFPKFKTLELVDNLRENTDLTNDQTNMLGNLLKLGKIQVVDIMVPRADIVAISASTNFTDTLELFKKDALYKLNCL